MLRITAICKDQIENVSALEVKAALREAGYSVEGVRVTALSEKQYEQAMKRH